MVNAVSKAIRGAGQVVARRKTLKLDAVFLDRSDVARLSPHASDLPGKLGIGQAKTVHLDAFLQVEDLLHRQTGLQQFLHPHLAVRSLRGVFPRPGSPGALHVGGREIEALRGGKLVLPGRTGRTPGMGVAQFGVGKRIARAGLYLAGMGRSRRTLQHGAVPFTACRRSASPDGLCRTTEREHPREDQ